jgi:hypothetical protein
VAPGQSPPDNPFDDPFDDRGGGHRLRKTSDGSPYYETEEVLVVPPHRLAPVVNVHENTIEELPRGAAANRSPGDDCTDALRHLRSTALGQISLNIDPRREPGYDPSKNPVPGECLLASYMFTPRCWVPLTFTWKASALCHKPLYFEQEQLERYGHSPGPMLEPVVSTAHFFANIAVLPYKMGINPPKECRYALGYYRPGSCAPWILDPIPISLRGAAYQAAAVGGLIYAIP